MEEYRPEGGGKRQNSKCRNNYVLFDRTRAALGAEFADESKKGFFAVPLNRSAQVFFLSAAFLSLASSGGNGVGAILLGRGGEPLPPPWSLSKEPFLCPFLSFFLSLLKAIFSRTRPRISFILPPYLFVLLGVGCRPMYDEGLLDLVDLGPGISSRTTTSGEKRGCGGGRRSGSPVVSRTNRGLNAMVRDIVTTAHRGIYY